MTLSKGRMLMRRGAIASRPTSLVTGYQITLVGISPANNHNAYDAMTDGSDSTYLQGGGLVFLNQSAGPAVIMGFPMPASSVTSFSIVARASTGTTSSSVRVQSITGITATPTLDTEVITTAEGITDKTLGPFTKSGGGSWTPAEFAAMRLTVSVTGTGVGPGFNAAVLTLKLYNVTLLTS